MKTRFKAFLIVATLASIWAFSLTASAHREPQAEAAEFFEKKVRPILVTNCAKCHNPKAMVAGLDLTTAEGFAHGGESGAVVDKAKPEESRLLKVIAYDGTMKMPPTGKLKDEDLSVLKSWVAMGAPWPGAEKPVAPAIPKNSSVRDFTEKEKAFWSFQPVRDVAPPKVNNAAWVQSPVDAFILAKLEEKGLKPAKPADRLTLLRRATFDLTGLPPTDAEIREFVADNSPDAFKKVVERLLASPRYGERWGRHWLDVARYADSTGNDEDHRYPHAWKYRDYVIESFNKDVPYNQFVREQVAGDLLPPPEGASVNRRGIVATGFLALGAKAIAQQDKKKMLYDVYDEQLDVLSKGFLGLTLACARCHNHKFDPLLTRDYYAFIGMFASTRSFSNPDSHVSIPLEKPLVPKAEFDKYKAARAEHQAKEKRARLEMETIVDEVKDPLIAKYAPRTAEFMLAAHRVYSGGVLADVAKEKNLPEDILKRWVEILKPEDLTPQHLLEWRKANAAQLPEVAGAYQQRLLARLKEWQEKIAKWREEYTKALGENRKLLPDRPKFDAGDDRFFDGVIFANNGPYQVSEKEKDRFTASALQRISELQKEIDALKKSAPTEPEMACAIEDQESVAQKVFIRGDYNNEGDVAPKSFPAILAPYDTKPAFAGSGRLQLADWLVRPDHPLTPRVMVNRIWQGHFGEGIVRTPDNFGVMGERPTHLELLDFLAKRFVEDGWSIKSMHRMMVLSSAYQMSSVNMENSADADMDNRLLSRFNRRRLSVEEIRDGLLHIDGTIDFTVGGTMQAGRGTDGENNQGRLSMNPEKLKRRTVYLPLRRANLPSLLNLFDFGDATTMSGKRQLTNVATQALFWLNSEFLTECSAAFVSSLLAQSDMDDAARIETAYLKILNRRAEKSEVDDAVKYLNGFRRKFASDKAEEKGWQSLVRVLMASNGFVYLD
jgi:hypothetical protein